MSAIVQFAFTRTGEGVKGWSAYGPAYADYGFRSTEMDIEWPDRSALNDDEYSNGVDLAIGRVTGRDHIIICSRRVVSVWC